MLIPINTKSLYKKIQISFKKNTPVKMKLWDSLGYRSEIYFTKHQLNKKINSTFQFYPPDGVDVIKHK
jgi:outer membrane lipoprotein-sorting protein